VELIDVVAYAWAAVGLVLTVAWVRRDRPPKAGCSCGHFDTAHDENGWCRHQRARPMYWENGHRSGKEYVQCPCRNPALGTALWGAFLGAPGAGAYPVTLPREAPVQLEEDPVQVGVTSARTRAVLERLREIARSDRSWTQGE
jgi:hypothetical protein